MALPINTTPQFIQCDAQRAIYEIRKINGEIWAFCDYDYSGGDYTDVKATIRRYTTAGVLIASTKTEIDTSSWPLGRAGYAVIETATHVLLFGYDVNGDGSVGYINKTTPDVGQVYYPIAFTDTSYPNAVLTFPEPNPDYVWIFDNDYFKRFSTVTQSFTGTVIGPLDTYGIPPGVHCAAYLSQNGGEMVYPTFEYAINRITFKGSSGPTNIDMPDGEPISCIKKIDESTIWVVTPHYMVKIDTASKSIAAQFAIAGMGEDNGVQLGYDPLHNYLFWLSSVYWSNPPVFAAYDATNAELTYSSGIADSIGVYNPSHKCNRCTTSTDGDWWFGGYNPDLYGFYLYRFATTDVPPVPVSGWNISANIPYPSTPSYTAWKGWFGMAVSITANGGRVVVAPEYGGKTASDAVAFVYDESGGSWSLTESLTAGTNQQHRENSIVIAGDGSSVLLDYVDETLGEFGTSYALFYNNTGL